MPSLHDALRRFRRLFQWKRRRNHTGRTLCLISALLLASAGKLWAGPPFQTDDPHPLDYRQYEFYIFGSMDAAPTEIDTAGPALEFNWGALPNLQLHAMAALAGITPVGETEASPTGPAVAAYGVGDTELGAVYRFVTETRWRPEIAISPAVELPTANAGQGLSSGTIQYQAPIWLRKGWGPWTSYGGARFQIVGQHGARNFVSGGWVLQRDIGRKWTLGGEIFSHGPEGPETPFDSATAMADFGGAYTDSGGLQLLFAYGHSVAGQSENYAYLGLYRTWGPKNAGRPHGFLRHLFPSF